MTEEQIKAMSQTELAKLWRFAPPGHPVFEAPLYGVFKECFKGFTPEISKAIGWVSFSEKEAMLILSGKIL